MCQKHRVRANYKQRRYEKRRGHRVASDISNDAHMRLTLDAIPTASPQGTIGTAANILFSSLSNSAEAFFTSLFEIPRSPKAATPFGEEIATDLPDFAKCTYVGSRCDNLRCIKLSGGIHRLCHKHRLRANDNRQRLRQRQHERAQDQINQACTATNTEPSGWSTDSPPIQPETTLSSSTDAITFIASGDLTQPYTATSGDHLAVRSRGRKLPAKGRLPGLFSTTWRYPGRQCMKERVVKLRGDLHRFCEYHRSKENQQQRRSNQRRISTPVLRTYSDTPTALIDFG